MNSPLLDSPIFLDAHHFKLIDFSHYETFPFGQAGNAVEAKTAVWFQRVIYGNAGNWGVKRVRGMGGDLLCAFCFLENHVFYIILALWETVWPEKGVASFFCRLFLIAFIGL